MSHITFLPIQQASFSCFQSNTHFFLSSPLVVCFNFFIRANSSLKTTELTAVSTYHLVANISCTSCPKARILAATAFKHTSH